MTSRARRRERWVADALFVGPWNALVGLSRSTGQVRSKIDYVLGVNNANVGATGLVVLSLSCLMLAVNGGAAVYSVHEER